MGKRSAHGGSLESWRCPEQRRGDRRDEVLPWYANTHTESSGTGLVTTRLREEARQLVREAVGGDEHVVIFTGSGSTGAIDKLMRILGLHLPSDRDEHREREAAARRRRGRSCSSGRTSTTPTSPAC